MDSRPFAPRRPPPVTLGSSKGDPSSAPDSREVTSTRFDRLSVNRGVRPRYRRRLPRGSSVVEFTLIAPIVVALFLWSSYFWETLLARVKTAEAARFVAFERTVRTNIAGIEAEAKNRYQDLNGVDEGVPLGLAFRNKLEITKVSAKDYAAPISATTLKSMGSKGKVPGGIMGWVSSLVGDSVEFLISLLGFDTNRGAVAVTVEFSIKNRLIPEGIAHYSTGFADGRLDLKLSETFHMYHDTWRAWQPGDSPNNSYAIVEKRTEDRVVNVAYLGITDGAVGGALSAIGAVLSALQLDFPFDEDFVRASVLIRPVTANGTYPAGGSPTRTVPGDKLLAPMWTSDSNRCVNCGPGDLKAKRGYRNSQSFTDNMAMRSYNCRGQFFQGARKSEHPEAEYSKKGKEGLGKTYFRLASNACLESQKKKGEEP